MVVVRYNGELYDYNYPVHNMHRRVMRLVMSILPVWCLHTVYTNMDVVKRTCTENVT